MSEKKEPDHATHEQVFAVRFVLEDLDPSAARRITRLVFLGEQYAQLIAKFERGEMSATDLAARGSRDFIGGLLAGVLDPEEEEEEEGNNDRSNQGV